LWRTASCKRNNKTFHSSKINYKVTKMCCVINKLLASLRYVFCVPCCFLVYGMYLPPLPLVFISLINPPPIPPVPFPCALWLCGPTFQSFICLLWIPNQLQIIYHLVIGLSVLCLMPCPVFVWGPPGLLATGSCCRVVWGLRSLNAAFPWWSCLSYYEYEWLSITWVFSM
jgi:hypothetical protein